MDIRIIFDDIFSDNFTDRVCHMADYEEYCHWAKQAGEEPMAFSEYVKTQETLMREVVEC